MYIYAVNQFLTQADMKVHPASISDIAKALGVAPSTVSRALRNHPDISQKTRQKIQEFARQVNYRPNALAIGLKHQRSRTIGIIIPEIVHYFFSSILSGIEEVAYSRGYRVMICQSNEEAERERLNLQALLDHRVDGLLVSVSKSTTDFGHFKRAIEGNIPMVFFDRICPEIETDRVMTDDFEAARLLTAHLTGLSRRRILHLAAPQHLTIGRDRCLGYCQALKDQGIEVDPGLILPCDTPEKVLLLKDQIIGIASQIDGVFAVNDLTAIALMQVIQDHGFSIPGQIAVAGFGDDSVASIIRPRLTTVEQKGYEMGKTAIEMLLERLENPGETIPSRKRVFPANLKVRQSTLSDQHLSLHV